MITKLVINKLLNKLCITKELKRKKGETMDKKLYATLSVAKQGTTDEIKIYKIKNEKFGIQIESTVGSKTVVNSAENITSSEDKINKLLDTLIINSENFTLLEDFAYDFADVMIPV